MPNENKLNNMAPSKAVPLSASKQDEPTPKRHSVSLNDTEPWKLMEEFKRLQREMRKLSKGKSTPEGGRLKALKGGTSKRSLAGPLRPSETNVTSPLPSLLVVIATIFTGFFLGKFIL